MTPGTGPLPVGGVDPLGGTVLTLGFYRFWMVTRLRRHYWNAIRIQGDPLEYTGTGREK